MLNHLCGIIQLTCLTGDQRHIAKGFSGLQRVSAELCIKMEVSNLRIYTAVVSILKRSICFLAGISFLWSALITQACKASVIVLP